MMGHNDGSYSSTDKINILEKIKERPKQVQKAKSKVFKANVVKSYSCIKSVQECLIHFF